MTRHTVVSTDTGTAAFGAQRLLGEHFYSVERLGATLFSTSAPLGVASALLHEAGIPARTWPVGHPSFRLT